MRPVDADLLKIKKVNCTESGPLTNIASKLLKTMFEAFGEVIDSIPTLDVQPVVHAHWEDNHESFVPTYRCSNCGYIRPIIAATPGNENPKQEPSNYCCNCGAKMDGGAKNGIC